jgi:hypothetical protein
VPKRVPHCKINLQVASFDNFVKVVKLLQGSAKEWWTDMRRMAVGYRGG